MLAGVPTKREASNQLWMGAGGRKLSPRSSIQFVSPSSVIPDPIKFFFGRVDSHDDQVFSQTSYADDDGDGQGGGGDDDERGRYSTTVCDLCDPACDPL